MVRRTRTSKTYDEDERTIPDPELAEYARLHRLSRRFDPPPALASYALGLQRMTMVHATAVD